jgi:saccharopine dehydrogenase-like NADP-dependent oxidoreductase
MKIVVVGGGMQGRVIAENLLARQEKPAVVIADLIEPALVPAGATFEQCDILDAAQASRLVKGADACALAVPSRIAHQSLENLLNAGACVADVSFTPDPPLTLDALAKKQGACCVVDCGVAPGLSHLLSGAAHAELGGLDALRIFVGGIPQSPPPGFHQAVYFNAADLLAEYVRPARARQGGKDVAPAPLDVQFEVFKDSELGTLQCFLSDGLRSLLGSYPDVPDMAEFTMRWPGHLDTMITLRQLSLLEPEVINKVAEQLTAKFPADDFPDVLLMVIEARRGQKRRSWRLIDRRTGDQSAVARTTGYTTAAIAMVLARREFTEPGVHPPERLGRDAQLTAKIIDDLTARGINIAPMVPAEVK